MRFRNIHTVHLVESAEATHVGGSKCWPNCLTGGAHFSNEDPRIHVRLPSDVSPVLV